MWRLRGDWLYSLFLLVIFTVEISALGILAWTFTMRLLRQPPPLPDQTILLIGVVITFTALLALIAYIMAYHIVSDSREQERERQFQLWLVRWGQVLIQDAPPPPEPLSNSAVLTLISLLQTLRGEDKDVLRVFAQTESLKKHWLKQLHARRVSTRLHALEAMATVGLPEFLAPVLHKLSDSNFSVRCMAAKSAAAVVAQLPAEQQEQAVKSFVEAIRQATLPVGVLKEALSLTEDAITLVLVHLLAVDKLPLNLLLTAINIVGRLRLLEASAYLTPHLNHPLPEVKAATLATYSQLDYLPPEAWSMALRCVNDPLEKVRIQAVRALALVPYEQSHPLLWQSLGASSWWVQQAAGEALLHQGDAGLNLLREAVRNHPDDGAAQTALKYLLDWHFIEDLQSEEWIWAQA